MQSTFSPYGETIERLKSTATILTESAKATKLEFRNIFSQVNQLQERVEECKTELEKHFEDRLETIKTETQEECDRLEQNNQAMRESILVLQEGIKDMMKGVAESVVSKSRGELSSYLTEHLSHCINNHVVYQLDRVLQQRQQTSSRRRLLAWASSMTTPTTSKPSSIGNNSGEMNSVSTSLLQHQAPFPSFSVSPNELTKAPSLIQSTHRTSHRCGIFTNPNDDLTSLADTSSVMEESCSIETPLAQSSSWFADLQLLDLPDPRSNNGRYTSNSFVINDHRNTKESGFNNESILSPHSGHTRFNTTEVSTTSFTNTNIPSFNHDERRNNEILQGTPKPQQKIANQSLNNQTGA